MTPLLFKICLTTVTLLHADFAIGSDLQDFVKTKEEYGESGSRQHFSKTKSLVIFIPDLPSESAGENYQEARKILLRSQDFSDENLKVDNDEQRMPAAPIIKKNSSNNDWEGYEWTALNHRPQHTSKEKMHILRQQALINKAQQDIEQRERNHERIVKEIVDFVSVHYQSCIYLAYEAQRIKTGHIVMDDFRKLAEDVEKQKYHGLKAKALKCGKPIREAAPFVWQNPSSLVIHVVKDSQNDGVY